MAPPNVLLVMTDQHALHAVGCCGAPVATTPHIDALARDGIRFTRARTPCGLCAPVRASMFSGLYPHRHGVVANNEVDRPDLDYFPRKMAEAGYDLGYSGKWHAGLVRTANDMGFEGYGPRGYGNPYESKEYAEWLQKKGFERPERVIEFHAEGEPKRALGDTSGYTNGPAEATTTAFIAETAMELIAKFAARDEPFFVVCSFWGPHAPYLPANDFKDLYDPAAIPPWKSFRDELDGKPIIHRKHRTCVFPGAANAGWDTWAGVVARYYAYVTQIDAQIGRLVARLKRLGIYDGTMIVFCADHGETIGIHGGAFDKGAMAYEEVYRVPLIFKMPCGKGAGTTRDHYVSHLDFADTFCELAGTAMSGTHGESLVSILEDAEAPGREHFVAEFHRHRFPAAQRIIWAGDHKYVLNFADTDELYDLAGDEAEMENLIGDPSLIGVREDLRGRLLEHMRETGDGQGPQWPYILERPFQP
jgi:arylsulfatase A-like enzyme